MATESSVPPLAVTRTAANGSTPTAPGNAGTVTVAARGITGVPDGLDETLCTSAHPAAALATRVVAATMSRRRLKVAKLGSCTR